MDGVLLFQQCLQDQSVRLRLLDEYLEERGAVGPLVVRYRRDRKIELAKGSQGSGGRSGSSGVCKACFILVRPFGAPSPCRPFPGYAAVQRAYDGERCVVGRTACRNADWK